MKNKPPHEQNYAAMFHEALLHRRKILLFNEHHETPVDKAVASAVSALPRRTGEIYEVEEFSTRSKPSIIEAMAKLKAEERAHSIVVVASRVHDGKKITGIQESYAVLKKAHHDKIPALGIFIVDSKEWGKHVRDEAREANPEAKVVRIVQKNATYDITDRKTKKIAHKLTALIPKESKKNWVGKVSRATISSQPDGRY